MTGRPGLQTRRGNASKHPGKVVTDLTRKRRSPAEVAAERAAAELKLAREKEEKDSLIREINEIQDRLRKIAMSQQVRIYYHRRKNLMTYPL